MRDCIICDGIKHTGRILLAFMVFSSIAFAGDVRPTRPSPEDKCPVCGMFVAKYPDWIGQILFKDGTMAFFDGAKDLFKYYFNLKKYNPKKKTGDVEAIFVTEYYTLAPIEASRAYFVIGSEVYGPMGHELVPLESVDAAEEFMKDHQGKQILKFEEITPKVIATLD